MQQVDFSSDRIGKNMALTIFPMLVAQMISLLYNIVDRIYIGRLPGIGTSALGGVGLCFPVVILILGFANLYGMGGQPLCAMERGRGKTEKAEQIMNTAYFLLLFTGVILTVLGEIFASPILRAFGASSENILYGLPYLRIYLLGTVFSMLATGLNPYINAEGYPRIGMLTVLIGAGLNLVLDPILMFSFGMGVHGAAVATVLSQAVSAAFVLRFLKGSGTELHLHLPGRRFSDGAASSESAPDKKLSAILSALRENLPIMKNIISLGAAPFIMQVTNSLVSIVCNRMLSVYGGDLYVSIMTVISSVRQILDTPVSAIAEGTSPIISYNYGARRPRNVLRAMRLICVLGVGYTAVMWMLILLRPALFIRIFSADPEVLTHGIPALQLYFFAFIFQALQYGGQSMFKSLGKKNHAIFFSIFRKVILVVPLTLLLPRIGSIGVNGVFIAEPVSNLVGGLACFLTMLLTVLPEMKTMEREDSASRSRSW